MAVPRDSQERPPGRAELRPRYSYVKGLVSEDERVRECRFITGPSSGAVRGLSLAVWLSSAIRGHYEDCSLLGPRKYALVRSPAH